MKRLRGVRVLAGLGAGLLTAQAVQAGGPTIYGQLNLSVDQLDNGTNGALNVSSNKSRIGVKGDIPIRDGLTGIYQIESEVNADTGNTSTGDTAFASRNTFAGLQGEYGTVRVGRFDTPVKLIGRQVDWFKDQVGDARNLTRGSNSDARFDERVNNSISYTSPTLAGFYGILHYASNTDNAATKDDSNNLVGAAVNYAQGPAFVGLGYEKDGLPSGTAGHDPFVVRLAGYYDIASWRVSALWQSISGTTSNKDEDAYGLGARYVYGVWTFKAQAYQLSSSGAGKDGTLLAAGAEYALHKAVSLYLDYASLDNDAQQSLTPYKEGRSDNLAVTTAGDTATGISLGTIIKF
jgi:predicted porin